jgi:hypothetical protein
MPSFMGRRLIGALALQHLWGEGRHSAMIGTYGINARKFPDSLDPTGPTDRFRDVGVDAQYQYITDRHRFSTQLNWISERQDLDATLGAGAASNPSDRLRTFKGEVTYYYDTKYGATLTYFRTTGNEDDALYNTGVPVCDRERDRQPQDQRLHLRGELVATTRCAAPAPIHGLSRLHW